MRALPNSLLRSDTQNEHFSAAHVTVADSVLDLGVKLS
jgi:hypothetical protein